MKRSKQTYRAYKDGLQLSEMYLFVSPLIVIVLCVLVLLGWQFDIEVLKRLSGAHTINPATATGMFLAALSLLLSLTGKQKALPVFISKVFSLTLILIGALKLSEHLIPHHVTIDDIFFTKKMNSDKISYGIQMPLNSACEFLLTGLSLLTFNNRKAFFSQFLSFITASIALMSFIGYVHGISQLNIPFQHSFLTLPIAICFLILSITMLQAGRHKGYMAEILSNNNGGRIARTLLPLFLIVPVILEFAHHNSEQLKLYSSNGIVLLFCTMLAFFFYIGLSYIKLANKADRKLKAEIQERQKVESEIKEKSLFLETILDNIPNMVFVKKGADLRFAAINKAGEQLLGLSRHECIGKTDADLFPKEQADFFRQKDLEILKNEKVLLIEEEPIFTDEEQRWLRTKKIPVKDNDGNPLYIVGISEDITEKKAHEDKIKQFYSELEQKVNERTEELSKSEKRFRALIENSTDCLTILDSSLIITYESPEVERITGYCSEQRTGNLLFKFVHPDDLELCNKMYRGLIDNHGEPTFLQYRMLHQKGNYIWIEGTATNLLQDESVKAIIFNYRDITERKKHEREREVLIKELTIHNQDLRQFSYITSHNLRAPLSNLLGLLELIKYTPIHDPVLKEIIGGFNTSTHSLNDTINDLLKILYIKENTEIDQEEIILVELFDKIMGQVSNMINQAEPEIIIDIKQDSIINFNRAYLESIFLNLLTNAIKYRSPERRLKLTIKMAEGDQISVVTFQDNGIGLDLEKHKTRVFGLYQRFHDYSDSKGLGLYLVKTQVEALGGKIEIESRVDAGTKFTLTFNKLYAEQSFFH